MKKHLVPVALLAALGLSSFSASAVGLGCDTNTCCGSITSVEVSGATDLDTKALITCVADNIEAPVGAANTVPSPDAQSCYTRSRQMIELATQALISSVPAAPKQVDVVLKYKTSNVLPNWCTSLEVMQR